MVFRGKLSKACQRCRDRRLKCDLMSGSCGQCVRAQVVCTGYRDTQQIRIADESQAVRRKALSKKAHPMNPRFPPISLEAQAREAFFAFHVTRASGSWDFLGLFYYPTNAPEHLALSIDAVSMAYFSTEVYSKSALIAARQKYVSALRMMHEALQSPELAAKDTTLFTSLLLDIFEKITNTKSYHSRSWAEHINGALALVKLRGLEQFQDHSSRRALMRLASNTIISHATTASTIPPGLLELRAHVSKQGAVETPKMRLSNLMTPYINLRSDIREGKISTSDYINASIELDAKFKAITLDLPPSWQHKITIFGEEKEHVFGRQFHSYPDFHKAQTLNVTRLVRILLNESILEHGYDAPSLSIQAAKDNIVAQAYGICASAPQFIDCFVGCHEFVDTTPGHIHSPLHRVACHTLIYPLFVVARSKYSPSALRLWVIKELHYMGSHFGMRKAELVAQILEQGTKVEPWELHAMLGSYAFIT